MVPFYTSERSQHICLQSSSKSLSLMIPLPVPTFRVRGLALSASTESAPTPTLKGQWLGLRAVLGLYLSHLVCTRCYQANPQTVESFRWGNRCGGTCIAFVGPTWLCHWRAVWPWASCLISLWSGFVISKMVTILITTSEGWKNKNELISVKYLAHGKCLINISSSFYYYYKYYHSTTLGSLLHLSESHPPPV